MAGDSVPDNSARETRWVVPAVTAAVLISGFCLYYFVYVAAQREYLANRNFRALAGLGDQVQTMVSIHGSILEFCADLADPKRNPSHRVKENLKQFLIVRPEDASLKQDERDQETRKDYLKYLAPNFDLTEVALQAPASPANSAGKLDVRRRNGRWELVLTAQRHKNADKDYVGSLDVEGVMKPLVNSLPFDDILLVSEKGTVVYQSNTAGPRFSSLNDLLDSQPAPAPRKGESQAGNQEGGAANPGWRMKPMHMTDVALAGTRYKVFLQPVLVDVFSDEPGHTEPHEWILCGLRSSKGLEWEALSISSTLIMGLTALFLAIWLSGPILKVLFMNQRERLRLRELGYLGLFLVLLTTVFTFTGLELAGYPLNDDTEAQLKQLGDGLSTNVHAELVQMRDQLLSWCKTRDLRDDLKSAENREVIRNAVAKPKTPAATVYPWLSNAFWTDDDGNQIVKWSAGGYLTPMIDVSRLSAFTQAKETYLDGQAPPFHFDSTLPPNKLEYLSALTISTESCIPESLRTGLRPDILHGSAFLIAQPLSLINPILPFGYGFALLDAKGVVLFHADKTKNQRENFLQESDESRQLSAAVFGHATQRSLGIKYLGKDYKARVIPITGVSQAPWSLIVYRDLTSVRTLNLQAMTMASTLLLIVLMPPILGLIVWCATQRPRFAPEWLWPNRARTSTYLLLVFLFAGLIVLFLLFGFSGSLEQSLIACAVIPSATLLLTIWVFRTRPDRVLKPSVGLLTAGFICLAISAWQRIHLRAVPYLSGAMIGASASLLDRPRRILRIKLRLRHKPGVETRQNSPAWRKYYALDLALVIFLIGVLVPAALFRASLNVERRLGVKQAQLHLASALEQRLMMTKEQCGKGELGAVACAELTKDGSSIWGRIVFDPLLPANGRLPVVPHSKPSNSGELYSDWLQRLVYVLHHDFNSTAAEMLGVIRDRANVKAGNDFPDWSWETAGSSMTLRWHGVHSPGPENQSGENDLLIESKAPVFSSADAFAGVAVAAGVMLVIGLVLWTLVRKIFLFHVEPLKISGERKALEAIRDGMNVVILVPPGSDWSPRGPSDEQKLRLDLVETANGPNWAEALELEATAFRTTIEIHHFEHGSDDPETVNQKFVLLDRLLKRENTQIVVILALPPSPEDPRRTFTSFKVVDLREEPFYWLKQCEGPARDIIWNECGPMAALWPIGVQLARDIKGDDSHSKETIASEILERADAYYRLVWKECTDDQKFALSQLAQDGLLNPANARAIRQLVRRGFITTDPQFRLMNESFRRFVRSAAPSTLRREWQRDSRRSGWGKVHGAFVTTMLILGVFLLTTQNALWESSAAYVTTALGSLGTLTRLFNTWRGDATVPEKGT